MLERILPEGNQALRPVDYAITHKLSGISTLHGVFREDLHFREEELLRDTWEGRSYRIKGIEMDGDTVELDGRLQLDDWESSAVTGFYLKEASLPEALGKILPEGWRAEYEAPEGKKAEISLEYGGTPLDIALSLQECYGCAMEFDPEKRICRVYDPSARPHSGTVLTAGADLLEKPRYTGKSTELVTRIYPVGAEGLTIGSVNGGKDYVECFAYTHRVISAVWKDERYEIAEHLRDAAQALVEQRAVPECAWEIRIHDLYRRNPEKWLGHRAELGDKITVCWGDRSITAQVAEEELHPMNPGENSLCIGSVPASTIGALGEIRNTLQNPHSGFRREMAAAIKNAAGKIAGSRGGRVITVLDEDGKPIELCILSDSETLSGAKSLWRWNQGGLGHSDSGYNGPFSLALTKDGAIVADRITAGTLNAGVIRAGILSDAEGKNCWNLDTGELNMESGTIRTRDVHVAGKLSTYDEDQKTLGGYVGYMTGSTGSEATTGIGVSDATGECYAIATDSGVRLQAGDYAVYVTRDGNVELEGSGGKLEVHPDGIYVTGPVYHRNDTQEEWKEWK